MSGGAAMGLSIEEAVRLASAWADIDGVEVVAQGKSGGQDCILVGVSRSEVASGIPQKFEGYNVVIEHTPKIAAQKGRDTG
jgi:hypothetical protein